MIPNGDEASTSHNVFSERLKGAYFDATTSFHDSSNVQIFYQPYPHEKKWTKDHPLHKIIGDLKSSVRTRGQLANSCVFSCLLSSIEPDNGAEALRDADWNKKDESSLVIRNKARLVVVGYSQQEGIDYDETFGMENCDTVPTPMVEQAKLKLDLVGKPVDHTDYHSMIGSLMYVTSSRPDIMFATCMCARYQANPNEHHVSAVKRIFRYLKWTINLGLWYPKDSGFDLTAYLDADHAGCYLDRKNYGFFYDKVPIYFDSKSAIAISCNPVQHTRTKHIDVRSNSDLPNLHHHHHLQPAATTTSSPPPHYYHHNIITIAHTTTPLSLAAISIHHVTANINTIIATPPSSSQPRRTTTISQPPLRQAPQMGAFGFCFTEKGRVRDHHILVQGIMEMKLTIAKKFNHEKERNDKLKEVKARLNFEERSGTSRYSESRTIGTKEYERRHRSRRSRSPRPSVFSRIKRDRSRSSRQNSREKEGGVFKRYTEALSESKDNRGGHWKLRSKKKKSSKEDDDLSQPLIYEEIDPFTPRIRYFDFPKTRIPSHSKTYDGSEDLEDRIKIFLATAKTERWATPTWCHMFNSTLTGNAMVWFDDFPTESIDSYDDLKKAFLENYLQQKKCIKDPIELHNIKQRDEESTKDFVRRYKLESRDIKGAPKCMRISGFVHGITNPELIKRLHDKISRTANEMMRVTTSFLRGEVAASSHERRIRPERKQDRFTLLTKNSKEIFALEKGKFKAPSPMTTPVEKQNHTKFYEFHDEDKALAILVVQPWERVAMQRITQSFSPNTKILFPPLDEEEGTEGPVIIEAEIGGRCIHRIGKVTISVHRNYWKTKTQETTSSSVNSSRNAKALGRKRSNYPKKQQKLADMTGIPRHIAEHRINVREGCSLVRKKKRGQAADRNHVIQEEVGKLIEARIMKEMPFGLRNAGATYRRLVDKAFHKHIGRNFKVYVDDLVIKSSTKDEIVGDIEETFKTLREVNMKLNPKMCTFGVEEGCS
nr:uncharacterized mitochondrial protein AtMg00810-like [Tanacetum cinerariifolium]